MKAKRIKLKVLVFFMIFYLMMSFFSVLPIQSTPSQTQTSDLTFNSTNFSLVNLTNNAQNNAFIYSYNITSAVNGSYTWIIDISQTNGVYTYQYGTLNGTDALTANVSRTNQIQYNFSSSGSYYVQVYWFSSLQQILSYKEYTAPNIIGLQTNFQTNNFSYQYWWYWQLSDPISSSFGNFNFSFDIYFSEQYNISLDYFLSLSRMNNYNNDVPVQNITGSKLMNGPGNTMQELTLSIPIETPGSYRAVFQWKDLLIYNLDPINRSIVINFNAPNSNIYPANPNIVETSHYYQADYFFPFSFMSSFFIIGAVFIFVVYVVHRNEHNYRRTNYYRYNNYPNNRNNTLNRNRPLIVSFCSNCGAKKVANGQYCHECGNKLE